MKRNIKLEKSALWLICVLVISLTSCKKDEVMLPVENDPVFRVDGQFDGENLSIVAGDDNAYMHTETKVLNGVNVFSGDLNDGNLFVKMGVYDGNLDVPSSDFLTQLPNTLSFSKNNNMPLITLRKDLFSNCNYISSINWKVDNVDVGSNNYSIYEPGKYMVCADVTFTDGTSNELCNELILGYDKQGDFSIKPYLSLDGMLSAWISDSSSEIEKVLWYLNGEEVSSDSEMSSPVETGAYLLRVDVFFANGAVRSKEMLIDGGNIANYIDDLSFLEQFTIGPLNRDFNLWIEVIKDGVSYHSENSNNESKSVTIDEIEYTGVNSLGNRTYRIKANVTATLSSNIQGYSDKPISFDVAFGIEIP
ncbi:MAG: hypothetical protein MK066_04295 [Crocinitomicaceae bacterium]|nr:hypothetical protein [Crocinitomicaceae bacterium]